MVFVECLKDDTALSEIRHHDLAEGVVGVYRFIENEG